MNNRGILITVSNEGIGFAIAGLCFDRGAHVFLHGLDAEVLKASARKLGPDVGDVVADLLDRKAPGRIGDYVIAQHGRIDALVKNAAMLERCKLEVALADLIDRMFAAKFHTPLMLIQAAAPHKAQQESGGSIVNIGSVNASCGAPIMLDYSATKGAPAIEAFAL